jgi:hypothetical protein
MVCRSVALGLLVLASLGQAVLAQSSLSAPAATCLNADIGGEASAPGEAGCLRELRGRASRKGDLLTIRLENGTTKTYRDDPKACKNDDAQHCISHQLLSYHSEAHVYSIGIQYYEGSSVELLSARTGGVLRLSGVPHFSPDGSRFVVIDNDYAYGGPYDLGIGSAANGALALEWQKANGEEPLEWRFQRWVDNDHVALRVFPADTEQKCPTDECDALLVRFGNGWIVRRSPTVQR